MSYTLRDFVVRDTDTLVEALRAIEKCRRGFVVVEDADGYLVGTLTDGDIRRKLIAGATVDERLCECGAYQENFVRVAEGVAVDDIVDVFRSREIDFVPFVDEDGRLKGLVTKGQLYGLLLQCEDLPDFSDLLNVDSHLMDFEVFQRPWGIYKTTVLQDKYQSKVLQVKPMAQLSLQYHLHREEYWIVASGEGVAQVCDSIVPVHAGSTVFIPRGCKHRMTNVSADSQLVIIEVQIGDYFGEDDIVRIEDRYGRVSSPSKE